MPDDTITSAVPTIAGTPFGGGFYVGRIRQADGICALIVAPRSEGERAATHWAKSNKAIAGACSYFDGRANTIAMAAEKSALAQWALDLRIAGLDDWYLPARDELELVYRHLKPGKYVRDAWRCGDNPSSVPPGYPYTKAGTVQTSAAAFQEGNAEALDLDWYWTSTQYAGDAGYAWYQYFDYGRQSYDGKSASLRARAVRRFLIQ